jgi:hypothetical protein
MPIFSRMSGFCGHAGADTNNARKNTAAIAREVLRWLFRIAHLASAPKTPNLTTDKTDEEAVSTQQSAVNQNVHRKGREGRKGEQAFTADERADRKGKNLTTDNADLHGSKKVQ